MLKKSGSSDYQKMLFFLISMQIGIFFVAENFELEVPLTETSKEINILYLLHISPNQFQKFVIFRL